MAAAAFLARLAASQRQVAFGKQNETSPAASDSSDVIARLTQTLTIPKLRRLISRLLLRLAPTEGFIWNWSG
ncbi:MAG: hypothetical protein ACK5IP_06250 [Paracoccus sp. (in: a-proteobacteria)]